MILKLIWYEVEGFEVHAPPFIQQRPTADAQIKLKRLYPSIQD